MRSLRHAAAKCGPQARIPGLQLVHLILEQVCICVCIYVNIFIKFKKYPFCSIIIKNKRVNSDNSKLRWDYYLDICNCKDFVNIDDSIEWSDRPLGRKSLVSRNDKSFAIPVSFCGCKRAS